MYFQDMCIEHNGRGEKTRKVLSPNSYLQHSVQIIYFRNVLRSIAIGIPFITIFYVLMNISYMTVLTIPEITNSTAVAMTFGNKLLTPFEAVMPLGVAISAFGCAMAYQFGISRFVTNFSYEYTITLLFL